MSLYWQAKAQNSTLKEPPTFPRQRWEVGTDLLWLINKNTLPATAVFIRRNVQPKNHLPGAIRLRLGMDWSKQDSTISYPKPTDKESKIAPFIRIGYEWQHAKGRYQFYYGLDGHFAYAKTTTNLTVLAAAAYSYEGIEKILTIGPVGFGGVKFFLSSHLSLSAEASYSIFYNHLEKTTEYWPYPNTDPPPGPPYVANSHSFIKVNYWQGKLNPIYILNINYHF